VKARILALLFLACVAAEGFADRRRTPPPRPLQLVIYVENAQGETVISQEGDQPINPASVVKVATSLWALEKLGPNFALETRFFARGGVDWERGTVRGDLVVQGGGDPDFQVENALLVARALNELGIFQVHGAVVVNDRFWMGWENGSAGTEPDPIKRGLFMATRLRQALDSRRWNDAIGRTWQELALRYGWSVAQPPRVLIQGGVGADGRFNLGDLLLVHRSKPLLATLHRFNAYSNNDIERLGWHLGPASELAGLLQARLGLPEVVKLETLSGLGENRLSPRGIVQLLRQLAASCQERGVELGALLPVAGCHPGTLEKFFPSLTSPPYGGAVAGKTGTLTITDGGVAALAGVVSTREGQFYFCLAVPKAQGRLKEARRMQEDWLLRFIDAHGGPAPTTCIARIGEADAGSVIIKVAEPPHAVGASHQQEGASHGNVP
jgi:D-alanyl-D-alanine carboxypeptidase/D-alanyl-D-alanine-endopeptidase (penicillin-binding protein 4)